MHLHVMVKSLRPHPFSICEITASHLSGFNSTLKAAIRQSTPRLVCGTGLQVSNQFFLISGR
jgi:hypothetical protein